jgi:hypothetical protein
MCTYISIVFQKNKQIKKPKKLCVFGGVLLEYGEICRRCKTTVSGGGPVVYSASHHDLSRVADVVAVSHVVGPTSRTKYFSWGGANHVGRSSVLLDCLQLA